MLDRCWFKTGLLLSLFIRPCHMGAILSWETRKALFYHAKPRSGNHGGEAWRGKTAFLVSGTIWPPCDMGELLTELQPSFSNIVTLIMILFYFCFSTSKIRLSDKIFVLFPVFQFLLYHQALD